MAINIGIVGLPNVGKSTLFNALSAAGAEAANFPFCTIEPNVGVVPVPDPRLDELARIYASKNVIPTSLEFVDIAGLVRGAAAGEGLGNKFLSHIRQVHAVAHVVRCFEDENIAHVEGSVDPIRDVETIETELALADLESVERRIEKMQRQAKAPGKAGDAARAELEVLTPLKAHLDAGGQARTFEHEGAAEVLRELFLLTAKPVMYVANVAEEAAAEPEAVPFVQRLLERGRAVGAPVLCISAAIEAELTDLPEEERAEYLDSLGLSEPGLHKVIRAGYDLLGLITFFTAGEKETRAWTVRRGATAPEAAGVIHSDFQRGFIRAEVCRWEDLVALGSEAEVKAAGKLRIEGKDYVVQDGDVMHFRFNV
ncbi:MAG: redox-regulated ATPase YchF [Deltaproteobacteria bacterium]|nr:MAG: redox-regulated ATPase YchF [Deltaproteobacteria bacterium]